MLSVSRAAVLSTPTFARYFSASAVVSRWLFSFHWYNLVSLIQSCFTDTILFHWYNLLSLIQSCFTDTILFHWYNLVQLIQSCPIDTISFHWYNLGKLIQSCSINFMLELMLRPLFLTSFFVEMISIRIIFFSFTNLSDYFSMWLNYLIVPYFVISFGCTLDANFN